MPLVDPALERRNHFGLSAFFFLYFAGVGFITPFLPIYWRSLGFSYRQIGALIALSSVAGAAALVPVGALSDRLRARRPFVVAGTTLMAAGYGAFPSLHGFGQFAVAQLVIGLGGTMSVAVVSALGADVFRRGASGRAFAGVRSWGTVGFLVTMAVVFVAPEAVAGHTFLHGAAALYAVAGAAVLIVRRPARATARELPSLRAAARLLLAPRALAFVAAYFVFYMALMSSTANLGLYLTAFRPIPPVWILPLAFAVSAGIELPFLTVMGRLSDRYGRMAPLRLAFAVLPIRLAGYALAASPAAVVLLQATHGLTFSVIAIVPFAYMADLTPPEHRATGQAVLNAASSAAYALGPLLAGSVADHFGLRGLYWFLSAVAVVGACVLYGAVREPARAHEAHEAAVART
ncbi:MAG: MFS transporter [Chthonomonadales bacterium]|nr:MFS transporter [Chthonomonadales bacterium]